MNKRIFILVLDGFGVGEAPDANLYGDEGSNTFYYISDDSLCRMQEEFAIPLDEPLKHADLLLSVSLLLFEAKGPDFFLPKLSRENS